MNRKVLATVSAVVIAATVACAAGCGGATAVAAKSPTCTTAGNIQYWELNGKYYKDSQAKEEIEPESVVIPALGHSYGMPVFSWNVDFTEAGAEFTCSRDGLHKHTEIAEISSVVTEATCADGKTVYTATVQFDNEIYTDVKEVSIAATREHSAAEKYESDETNHWYECSDCHNDVGLAAHTFEWKTDKEATATETGLRHEECTVCEYKRNENTVIPSTSPLEHYAETDSTCTTQGNIEYWELEGKYYRDESLTQEITLAETKKPLLPHTSGAAYEKDENQHWHNCSVCGNVAGEKVNHTFEWIIDKQATESETGLKHEECTACKYKRSENTEIPATGVLVHHPATNSTCTTQGNIEYWEIGGKYYSDAEHTQEITLESTLKELLPHNPETVWQNGDGKHWHNCSVCGNPATDKITHSYTDMVKAPTCEEQGYTSHTCECGYSYNDNETAALGHDYANESVFDAADNKFYKVCKNDANHKVELTVYLDRKVKVNGVEYTPVSCYTTENSFVTYDAIEQLFVIHLNGTNFAEGLTIEGNNNEVAINVDENTTIAFLTFKNGFRKLYVRGEHVLTLTGDLSSEANPTTIECDTVINGQIKTNSQPLIILSGNVTLNNGINETAHNITVGSADNSTSPVFTVNVSSSQAGINSSGFNALNVQLLSGTTSLVQQDADNNCGISCHRADDVITVGEHATFNITNFRAGIAGWGDAVNAANINIYGTVNITGCGGDNNPAIQNIVVNVGSEQAGGVLRVSTASWAITGGKINLVKGKALLARATDDSGFAAFNGISELTVKSGFILGMKSLSVSIFGGDPTKNIEEGAVIAVYNMRDADSIVTNNYGTDLNAFLEAIGEN